MRKKRSNAPKPASGPPANTEAAALLIREYAVKLYDRQDGKGVDWGVVANALFRAAFDALDQISEDKAKQALAWKVHAGAERRATGGHAVKDDRPVPEFPES